MITKTLLVLAALLVVLLIVAALRPSAFRVERSAAVAASPAAVFAHINDVRQYAKWNPFGKADPNMTTTFEGPSTGQGAIMTWAGNSQVGEGRLTITESRPNELVRMKLDFHKPFPSVATAEFTLQPQGNQTLVTWSLSGNHTYLPRLIGIFMSMDKMIGGQFERGLTDLKTLAETK